MPRQTGSAMRWEYIYICSICISQWTASTLPRSGQPSFSIPVTQKLRTCMHTCKCPMMNASVPDQSARQRAVSWGIVGGWRIIGGTGFVGLMPHSCFGQSWDQRKECLITMPKRDSIMPNFLWVSKTLGIAE